MTGDVQVLQATQAVGTLPPCFPVYAYPNADEIRKCCTRNAIMALQACPKIQVIFLYCVIQLAGIDMDAGLSNQLQKQTLKSSVRTRIYSTSQAVVTVVKRWMCQSLMLH